MSTTTEISFFRSGLYAWAARNPRPMPWKGEKDPYKIWLSEIILQQTRVEQGLPYYEKFVRQYPTVQHLAEAPEDEVFKLWEGLGYYTRARNLHAAARYIAGELGGKFPSTYAAIRDLKGVGDYTAAAIASFGFNLPHAVLDGNVYRILARYFGIETPTDLPAAKKAFSRLAQELLDGANPAQFNQAMMDFGALCCTPAKPGCPTCPMQKNCRAFQQNQVDELPVRIKKAARKQRYFLYAVVRQGQHTFIRKRSDQDLWKGLYEFPCLEFDDRKAFEAADLRAYFPTGTQFSKKSETYRQILTHREVLANFQEIHLPPEISSPATASDLLAGCSPTLLNELEKKFAFPGIITGFLKKII